MMDEWGRQVKFGCVREVTMVVDRSGPSHWIAIAACRAFGHRWSEASGGWTCDRCRKWNLERRAGSGSARSRKPAKGIALVESREASDD